MTNMQTYDQFVEGFKGGGIRRIGPGRPLPGRPGKPGRPVGPGTKPKPKPGNPVCKDDKVNEDANDRDYKFEQAISSLYNLSLFLEMPEKDLCEIIYNTVNWEQDSDNKYNENTIENINALAYSYGLI